MVECQVVEARQQAAEAKRLAQAELQRSNQQQQTRLSLADSETEQSIFIPGFNSLTGTATQSRPPFPWFVGETTFTVSAFCKNTEMTSPEEVSFASTLTSGLFSILHLPTRQQRLFPIGSTTKTSSPALSSERYAVLSFGIFT